MTDVDAFLDDLDRLATTAATDDAAAFYRQLLPAASMAIGADAAEYVASAGAVDHRPQRWNLTGPLVEADRVQRVRLDGMPRVVPGLDGEPVVAVPVESASGPVGVIGFRLGDSAATPERSIELAAAVAEIAGRYELRCESGRVQRAQTRLARIEKLLVRLHSKRGLRPIAHEAAEQGRLAAGCDRLSVLTPTAGGWRIVTVSGVAQVSRRSDAARAIERIANTALRGGEPLRYPSDDGRPLSPPIADEVDRYCEASGVRALRVLPCVAPADGDSLDEAPRLAMLAEWFDGAVDDEGDAMLAALARHMGVAAMRDRSGGWGWAPLSRTATALAVVGLLLAAVVFALVTPATLWLQVDGRFEPVDQARVFAPLDGVVREVLVKQADQVSRGQPLVRLESPDLQLKQEEVAEAIAATQSEIASLETEKLRASLPGRGEDREDATTIASRAAALRERLSHQQKQRELLEAEAAKLLVTSPIKGDVVSWRPEDYLADRPVRRGQRLLEVAADGHWRLELEAPDHRVGPLLRAQATGEPLRVEYVVRSDPAQTHTAVVTAIADATQTDEEGSPVVRVVADPADAAVANPRSGLGVSAKIDCGTHSLAYVWLHEAIDAIRRRWF
ncbi:biotin/lipoyl-binding protein [Botrimarina mediterranea]|uniref:biotin/lipoyl-binding protein n=1 Tax=Botrimarina mediterranea TaxID=2528022 RepID=UPI00118B5F4B|nr:HlyD family secretion protein [Planctomycetes bacterium K2D]